MSDDLLTAVRAALARHPEGVVVGVSAAVLWGAVDARDRPASGGPGPGFGGPGLAGTHPVELVVEGPGRRPFPGLRVRRDRLRADEVVRHEGVRLTSPRRTAYDVARRLPTVDAVVVVEALGRRHGVTPDDVRAVAAENPHAWGLVRMRAALALVEPDARSAFESRVRIALVAAGIRAPVVGHVVVDVFGCPLGVTDLAWPEERCALLCDRDEATARLMAGLLVIDGWTVQQVSRDQFRGWPHQVVEQAAALVRWGRRRQKLDLHAVEWSRPRRRRPPTVRLYPEAAA